MEISSQSDLVVGKWDKLAASKVIRLATISFDPVAEHWRWPRCCRMAYLQMYLNRYV